MNTSIFSNLNWAAIGVATLAYFFIGAIWYSALFQKKWIAYQKLDMNDPEARKGAGAIMFSSFLMMIIAVICLAMLVERMDLSLAISGIKLGLTTGIGLAATAISISYVYVKKPLGLHLIDNSYHITAHIAAAVILCLWR